MDAIGWYGPLIDLSRASSHLDDFVQLLVFVRHCQPVQRNNASKGGILKTNIQVGDDTRSYFSVSLWQKHMGTMVVAGDVILLQNVKIVKFRDVLEATTVQISGLIVLVHSYELTSSIGTDELFAHRQLGEITREKLRRVIRWVQLTESTFQHLQHVDYCQALLLEYTLEPDGVEEQMFASKRLFMMGDNKNVEDIICTGCRLCGYPISSRCILYQDKTSLYCQKSCKYLHDVCFIYRPFLLHVWDKTGRIPLLVKNKAAEILFGNITAENVYNCYKEQKNQIPHREHEHELHRPTPSNTSHPRVPESVRPTHGNDQLRCEGSSGRKKPNFYRVWLILLKVLLQQGKNSPFRFEIAVDGEKDLENGRFELVSIVMPCYKTGEP